MDTDFRMFSFRHKGRLPGIDMAHILDGSAYHTSNDNLARLRPGLLQVSSPTSVGDFNKKMKKKLCKFQKLLHICLQILKKCDSSVYKFR